MGLARAWAGPKQQLGSTEGLPTASLSWCQLALHPPEGVGCGYGEIKQINELLRKHTPACLCCSLLMVLSLAGWGCTPSTLLFPFFLGTPPTLPCVNSFLCLSSSSGICSLPTYHKYYDFSILQSVIKSLLISNTLI